MDEGLVCQPKRKGMSVGKDCECRKGAPHSDQVFPGASIRCRGSFSQGATKPLWEPALLAKGSLGEEKRIRLQAGSYRGCEYRVVLVENRTHCLHFVNSVDPVFQLLSAGAVQPGFDLRRHFAEAAP